MGSKVSLINQFDRVLAQPIETNTIFTSYENAYNYVKNGNTAYDGQIIVVVNDSSNDVYTVTKNKELLKIGSYYAVFDAAASPQTILHNLGRCPNVVFVGSDGIVYEVDIKYPSLNQVTVTWNNSDIKGKIYLL